MNFLKINKGWRRRLQSVLSAGIIFMLAVLFCMNSTINILNPNGQSTIDSSVFQTVAMYMDRGLMPYRDIFDHKGPLIYIYNWLGMQIAYYRGIWFIEVLSMFATFLILYKIARMFCGRIYAIIAVMITAVPLFAWFTNGNYTEEYALPYIAGALYIFTDYFLSNYITRIRLCVCGFCFGAVLMLRPNMISVWLVFCIAVLIKVLKENRPDLLLEFILFFIIGTMVLILPIVLWLCVNGAFQDMIRDYILFNLKYSSDGTNATWANRFSVLKYFMNNICILCAVVASAYLAYKKRDIYHIAYLIWIPVTFLLLCMPGKIYQNYGIILIPLEIYPFSRILSGIEHATTFRRIEIVGLIVFLVVCVFPEWVEIGNTTITYYWPDREDDTRTTDEAKVAEVVQAYTDEDDQITVFSWGSSIYVLSGRLSASRYVYQVPIASYDSGIIEEYFEDLKESNPALIVIPSAMEEYDDYGRMDEFLNEYGYEILKEVGDCKIYTIES